MDASGMFHLGTPLWEIVVRTLVVYLVVLFGLRLFGKRQLGQMSTGDLVMILLIANAVQNAMVGTDTSLLGGLVAAATLLIVNVLIVRSMVRSSLGERIFEGEPTLLVKDGGYLKHNIGHEGLAVEEVDMAIREHGIDDVSGVRVAYLEPDGTISVVPIDAQVLHGRRKVKRIRQFRRGG
jgi:uncharacterized membrane protein YcaP (DUF421 family)